MREKCLRIILRKRCVPAPLARGGIHKLLTVKIVTFIEMGGSSNQKFDKKKRLLIYIMLKKIRKNLLFKTSLLIIFTTNHEIMKIWPTTKHI